jgi:RNA polymerase sigma-70 factor, ECF subfamily
MQNLDDNQLAVLAAKGRQDAFGLLYDRNCQAVARALASFANCDQDVVDDLTQEVFVKVIKSLKGYKPIRPFGCWLYTVTLNVGCNYVRSRSKIKLVEPGELEQVPENRNEHPGLTQELLGMTAMKAAGKLPEHLRDVLALRISSGMPYAEIGEIVGIPPGTARRRMHQALNQIRTTLGLPGDTKELQNGQQEGLGRITREL